MTQIRVSQKTYNNVKLLAAFSFGASLGSGLGYVLMKKQWNDINKKVSSRYQFVLKSFREMEAVARDITMSGEEREKKIDEILEFVIAITGTDLI